MSYWYSAIKIKQKGREKHVNKKIKNCESYFCRVLITEILDVHRPWLRSFYGRCREHPVIKVHIQYQWTMKNKHIFWRFTSKGARLTLLRLLKLKFITDHSLFLPSSSKNPKKSLCFLHILYRPIIVGVQVNGRVFLSSAC